LRKVRASSLFAEKRSLVVAIIRLRQKPLRLAEEGRCHREKEASVGDSDDE
jgi:hypothetical protein